MSNVIEVFKYNNPIRPLQMEDGEIVNGVDKIEWTERYREADEFTLTGKFGEGLYDSLKRGDFISHTKSSTVMVVENVEIREYQDQDAQVTISGRSIESILEYRPFAALHITQNPANFGQDPPDTGAPFYWGFNVWWSTAQMEYLVEHWYKNVMGGEFWADSNAPRHVEYTMNEALLASTPSDANDAYSPVGQVNGFYAVSNTLDHSKFPIQDAVSSEGAIYPRILESLEADNLGLRVERPRSVLNSSSYTTLARIHAGEVLEDVVLTSEAGDIVSAEYLWSDRDYYNTVIIRTTHACYRYANPFITGLDRRTYYEEFTEADDLYAWNGWDSWNYVGDPEHNTELVLPETIYTRVKKACYARAQEILGKHKRIGKAVIEVSKNLETYKFREDFHVGDIIMVDTQLLPASHRRVAEYVEVQDQENGYVGYPVLEAPNSKYHGLTATE